MRITLLVFLCVALANCFSQNETYSLFNAKRKSISLAELADSAKNYDVVLFGEFHDDSVIHVYQKELAELLFKRIDSNLVLGAEMFERHQKDAVNQYLLSGNLRELVQKENLWPNFQTDYLPFLNVAKDNKLDYISSNITRKFASLVFKKGIQALDTISDEDKKMICPLPFPLDSTSSQYQMLIKENGENFVWAQAIKDATMAFFILKELDENKTCLHINGSFHSNYHQGIYLYLKYYQPSIRIMTISVIDQKNKTKLKKKNCELADYIFVR